KIYPLKNSHSFVTSANRAVICCGLVIAPPTTTAYEPSLKAVCIISGVITFPSATTGFCTLFTTSFNNSKSFAYYLFLFFSYLYQYFYFLIYLMSNSITSFYLFF